MSPQAHTRAVALQPQALSGPLLLVPSPHALQPTRWCSLALMATWGCWWTTWWAEVSSQCLSDSHTFSTHWHLAFPLNFAGFWLFGKASLPCNLGLDRDCMVLDRCCRNRRAVPRAQRTRRVPAGAAARQCGCPAHGDWAAAGADRCGMEGQRWRVGRDLHIYCGACAEGM